MTSRDEAHRLGLTGVLVPTVARGLIRSIGASLRLTREGFERLDDMASEGLSAVLAFFHGRQFILAYAMIGRRVTIMSSLSRDGELQARTLSGFGYRIVRGSASKGGARALIETARLMEQGYMAAVAVDGPRGPIHKVKPGAIYLAKRGKVPLLPMAASAAPAKILEKAWDRYLLPLPFSRGIALLGEPMFLDPDISEEAIERDCTAVGEAMLSLQEEADRRVGRVER